MMTVTLLLPAFHLLILLSFSLVLTILFLIQFTAGLWNGLNNCHCKKLFDQRPILNLFLFHHLIICIVRCVSIATVCFLLIISQQCLSIEILIHLLSLLSTFDLLLIIIGETAHFWDSTIKYQSTLYSTCCLMFGLLFNYFASILFLSIHITMRGTNPLLIEMCRVTFVRLSSPLAQNHTDDKSSIPTTISFVLFILIDLLTLSWIYVSYRDIHHLKRKRLATVFFYSLVFTKFHKNERSVMVNRSLKRLLAICLFLISNIITTLPVLTIKMLDLSLKDNQRILLLYLTTLPWLDCLTFLFYNETRFNRIDLFPKSSIPNVNYHRQQRIGRRLSSYHHSVDVTKIVEKD